MAPLSVRGILQEAILEWVAIPSPGDLPNSGTEPVSSAPLALADGFFTTVLPGKLWDMTNAYI